MRGWTLISVVIPTRGRPQLVVRAVKSALQQSHALLEVIVVIDGPDPETGCALKVIDDDRLRVIALEESTGGSEARNIGVRAARGDWIAFLDDDDQWVAEKLERQMMAAANAQADYPVISSRLCAQSADGVRILPRRLYTAGCHVADYLFCRRGFFYGDGMLQTSTLLAKRGLLLEVPFRKGLKRHQDWDWLLRVWQRPEVKIVMLPEALTVMQVAGQGESVSRGGDWRTSLAWAKEVCPLMGARAYAFFIVTECVPRARKCRAGLGAQVRLFGELLGNGRMGLKQLALFLAFSVFPGGLRDNHRGLAISVSEWREAKQT